MHVRIDDTWKDVLAFGVDDAPSSQRHRLPADGSDLAVMNGDLGTSRPKGRDHFSAADQEVELCQGRAQALMVSSTSGVLPLFCVTVMLCTPSPYWSKL